MNWIRKRRRKLGCYSGMYSARPDRIARPATVKELKKIFADAQTHGQKVTLRAGAHAFDAQALGDELVVSMEALNSIDVLEPQSQVQVGPGARWGDIVKKLQPLGLVPAGTVTSSHATAGGTLASDCLSRFSPRYGKEARWAETFTLLTLAGQELVCTPPPAGSPPASWTDEQRMFMAAVGGFGYLGAIVNITYRLLRFPAAIRSIETTVEKYETFRDLATALVPATRTALDRSNPTEPDALYAGLYLGGRGGLSWMLFSSRFSTESKLRRLSIYWPESNPLRIIGEWLMRVRLLRGLLTRGFLVTMRNHSTFVDDLHDFLFFMDANTRAKRIAHWFGLNLRTIQQTFIVPVDLDATGASSAEARLVNWLNYAHGRFAASNLEPALQDVLYLPEDLNFNLSPDPDTRGFAVSYAFETSSRKQLAAAVEAFRDLADHLWNSFGGRVSLVKNVYVCQTTLANMYGAQAREFFKLKTKYDPQGLLRNDFLDRTFGGLVDGAYGVP
jgi:decaprenylphospho-beta-D-ribofuranose 2-oxidase